MRRRAFTLIEMAVVLAIMLLVVAMVLPTLKRGMDEGKLRESSRQLNSYFAMAKTRAATTGRPCGVWFVTEPSGVGLQSTQLYLAEVPPAYSGDIQEATVSVASGPFPWQLTFAAGSNGGLYTLVADGEQFGIRFDHKQITWPAQRQGGQFFVTGLPIAPQYLANASPPRGNANGYQYEILRNAKRIGQPLALPRGTAVDMSYSGMGNTGCHFFNATSFVAVLFAPDGRVNNVQWNNGGGEAESAIHFLVGRPERSMMANTNSPPGGATNIGSLDSVWVSVGALNGQVVTTDNAYTENPAQLAADNPAFNPGNPLFTDYVLSARKLATDKGGVPVDWTYK